jgi:hypothetical protein
MIKLRNSLLALQVWLFIQIVISVYLVIVYFKIYHIWIIIGTLVALIFPIILISFASSVVECLEEMGRDSKSNSTNSAKSYRDTIDILNR